MKYFDTQFHDSFTLVDLLEAYAIKNYIFLVKK